MSNVTLRSGPGPYITDQLGSVSESESELALLARYVYTYEEFAIVTEAPQYNRITATGQDTYYKIIIYK